MDLKRSNSIQPHSHSHEGVRKVNLMETAAAAASGKKDGKRNVVDAAAAAPSTPGRPVFSFSSVRKKQLVPSKWDDAEKWLQISDHHQNQNHHLHGFAKSTDFVSKKSYIQPQEKLSVDVLLKDKLTNEVESFVFKEEVESSRDIGTEMTPLGSSATTRCHTPFKTLSPPRHNTPTSSSSLDIQECHLVKLKPTWTSREEEEEDVSKSLTHNNEYYCRKSISSAWEQQQDNYCLRYQREESKIQAWVDLQNAKAEAQSRKLEVKIQKMRSKFEEKLMRKMAIVHRKADELRAAAQLEHTHKIQRVKEEAINMQFSSAHNCGCFPYCNNLHP